MPVASKKKHVKGVIATVTALALVYHFLPCNRVHRSDTWQPMASFRLAVSNNDSSSERLPVTDAVPRIIHQTWRDVQLPEMLQPWLESWVRLNPSWEYWFWTDDDLHSFIAEKYPQFLSLFESYPSSGYRADVFRYFVLFEYGGVYADLDMECLRPLDSYVTGHSCFVSQEPLVHAHFLSPTGIPLVSNALMACTAGHPFFGAVIRHLKHYAGTFIWNDILHATGPFMLTDEYKAYTRGGWFYSDGEPIFLSVPEDFHPIVDTSRIDYIRDLCVDAKRGSSALHETHERRNELCAKVLEEGFRGKPPATSYTHHHWTHLWAGGKYDPLGVFNSRETFSVEILNKVRRK